MLRIKSKIPNQIFTRAFCQNDKYHCQDFVLCYYIFYLVLDADSRWLHLSLVNVVGRDVCAVYLLFKKN